MCVTGKLQLLGVDCTYLIGMRIIAIKIVAVAKYVFICIVLEFHIHSRFLFGLLTSSISDRTM